MERKIGEVFEVDGVNIVCVEDTDESTCNDCFFSKRDCGDIKCIYSNRKDNKNVLFKELKN